MRSFLLCFCIFFSTSILTSCNQDSNFHELIHPYQSWWDISSIIIEPQISLSTGITIKNINIDMALYMWSTSLSHPEMESPELEKKVTYLQNEIFKDAILSYQGSWANIHNGAETLSPKQIQVILNDPSKTESPSLCFGTDAWVQFREQTGSSISGSLRIISPISWIHSLFQYPLISENWIIKHPSGETFPRYQKNTILESLDTLDTTTQVSGWENGQIQLGSIQNCTLWSAPSTVDIILPQWTNQISSLSIGYNEIFWSMIWWWQFIGQSGTTDATRMIHQNWSKNNQLITFDPAIYPQKIRITLNNILQ